MKKTNKNTNATPVAIVSGGLGDIGRAIGLAAAKDGHHVAIGDRAPAADAAQLLRELESFGVRACYHRVDVADPQATGRWVVSAASLLGPPTLCVPNAAISTQKPLLDLKPTEWRREFAVNLDGAFHLAQAAARAMIGAVRPASIVFIGSWAGHTPHPEIPAYAITKAALRMLMQSLAAELAPHGIRVNEVAPGYVNAGLSGKIFCERPDLAKSCRRRVPLGTFIEPAEVAEEVLHLSVPRNRNVTGATILIDGGLSLGPLATRQ